MHPDAAAADASTGGTASDHGVGSDSGIVAASLPASWSADVVVVTVSTASEHSISCEHAWQCGV
jgi:hypothetical protein